MIDLHRYSDIHSHRTADALRGDTVVCITPGEEMLPGGTYSVGIHPWHTIDEPTASQLAHLHRQAADNRCVAIGECGFDLLRGGPIERQQRIFLIHARIAQQLHKPLIIHCVHADHLLMAAIKAIHPTAPWIIHGFRGSQARAQALLRAGLSLSINKAHPLPYTLPADRIYPESDAQQPPANV